MHTIASVAYPLRLCTLCKDVIIGLLLLIKQPNPTCQIPTRKSKQKAPWKSSSQSLYKKGTMCLHIRYYYYNPELCAKVGKYANTSGKVSAVKKLGKPISESTVCGFNKAYCSAMSKTRRAEPIERLEHRLWGQPLLLGNLDKIKVYSLLLLLCRWYYYWLI